MQLLQPYCQLKKIPQQIGALGLYLNLKIPRGLELYYEGISIDPVVEKRGLKRKMYMVSLPMIKEIHRHEEQYIDHFVRLEPAFIFDGLQVLVRIYGLDIGDKFVRSYRAPYMKEFTAVIPTSANEPGTIPGPKDPERPDDAPDTPSNSESSNEPEPIPEPKGREWPKANQKYSPNNIIGESIVSI